MNTRLLEIQAQNDVFSVEFNPDTKEYIGTAFDNITGRKVKFIGATRAQVRVAMVKWLYNNRLGA